MKKMFIALSAVGLMFAASSCKKCGYCDYGNGSHSDAVCRNSTLAPIVDEYKQAEADCQAQQGNWVVTK